MVPQKIHEVHATIHPTRAEIAMMLVIVAMLALQLGWTIRAVTYEPPCVPAIIEDTK
jgi:hypothetical protein